MSNEPTVLDIFSGVGGFSLAFHAAGFRTIGFVEFNPIKRAVLEAHFTGPFFGDIDEFDCSEFLRTCGRPDVIAGGPPCQAASLLGKRLGTADTRWKWPATIRLVGELRPRYCVFENPPAILTLDEGRAFNGIVSAMAALGYDGMWDVIPAAAFGAGHWRERLCIVFADAHRGAEQGINRKLPTPSERSEFDQAQQNDTDGGKDSFPTHANSSGRREGRQGRSSGDSEGQAEQTHGVDAANPHRERWTEERERLLVGESGNALRLESSANSGDSLSTDTDHARPQRHARDGDGGGGRQESNRPTPAAYILPDLRNRVTGPDWWYEAVTGIPVLVSGLPGKLVEAASLCIGDSIVPQAFVPIAQAIHAQIRHAQIRQAQG